MAVITVIETQAILGITKGEDMLTGSTEYENEIAYFIPIVQDDLVEYLGNAFQDDYVSVEGTLKISESTGRGDKITDVNAKFLEAEFAPGMDIALEGGYSNVGIWTISSSSEAVEAGNMFLTTTGEVIAQDRVDEVNVAGNITVSRVKWPKGLKAPVAKMIWHLIDKPKDEGVKSESLGDYSVTYAGSNLYPETVLKGLDKYKMVKMV